MASYQLGRAFPGLTWLQWNGKFRDDVRCAVRGDPGRVPDLMRRLYGSDDLFPDSLEDSYRPYQSVNFVTAHDGFCLYDLVSLQPQAQRGQRLRQPGRRGRELLLELRLGGGRGAPRTACWPCAGAR